MNIVRLENLFDLRDTYIKTRNNPSWNYEVIKEDIESLPQMLRNIYPKPLVKMKLNKLLAARKIISIHAWKGRVLKMKFNRCQLTYDILLIRSYDNNWLRLQARYVFPLLSVTIKHPIIIGKLIVSGKIIPRLFKMHKFILVDATFNDN